MVNMDPIIAQKLAESNHVSISKGKSAHLLKVGSKRRRGKEEMREAKQTEANRDGEHNARKAQLRAQEQMMARMRAEYELMQHELNKREGAFNYVKQMVEEGELEVDDNDQIKPLQSKMKQ